MKARKIFLLLAVLLVGGSLETAWTVRDHVDFGPAGCRVIRGKFYGNSFDFDSEEVREVAGSPTVEIDNAFGRVKVARGDAGRVRVALRKTVFQSTEEPARAFSEKVHLQVTVSGSTVRIGTNRDQLERGLGDDVGFETHLDVFVPAGASTTVRSEHGRVEVADVAEADVEGSNDGVLVERVHGAARIKSRHGDVVAADIGGTLDLTSRNGSVSVREVAGPAVLNTEHGDVTLERTASARVETQHGNVTARGVRGDLEIDGRHAAVSASEVTGKASVETGFQKILLEQIGGDVRVKNQHGDVELSDVKGTVTVESSFQDVVLARIKGAVDVSVEHGGVRAEALATGGRIKSSGGDVNVDGFRGALQVDTRRASVHLVPEGALTDEVTVRTEAGEIRLAVPTGSRFALEASANGGEVRADDVPSLVRAESGRQRVSGPVGGGGKTVRLEAERGDVVLESRPAIAAKEL